MSKNVVLSDMAETLTDLNKGAIRVTNDLLYVKLKDKLMEISYEEYDEPKISINDEENIILYQYDIISNEGDIIESNIFKPFELDDIAIKVTENNLDTGYYGFYKMALYEENKKQWVPSLHKIGELGDVNISEIMPNTINELVEVIDFYNK